jgi:hypothetical protein
LEEERVFGSAIVDVAVGLVFVYFILSVVASHINELIATLFRFRANQLERAITELLDDSRLSRDVLSHPLVRHFAVDDPGRKPSYISPHSFALALLDVLATGRQAPKTLPDLQRLNDDLAPQYPVVHQALRGILNASQRSLEEAHLGIEHWFNDAMDRLSGAYKRELMWMNLTVAACLAILVGVDTIAIATALWHEQGVRTALAGAAQAAGQSGIEGALSTLAQFNLPLGWATPPTTFGDWALKIVGLALTTVAVSLGAPFWFDLLSRISNLRSSGPAPKRDDHVEAVATPSGPRTATRTAAR